MTTIHAIIPACNESRSIGRVVTETRKHVDICLVVDDGSRDKTGVLARAAGAELIRLPQCTGTGNATKIGLQYPARHNGHIVCLLDGDGQHDPSNIPRLIAEIDKGADLVIGSRYNKPTKDVTTPFRRWGSKMISLMISAVYKKHVYDPTSGFRAMNRRTLEYIVDRYPTFFPEPEVIIDLIKKGFVIREVSVQMKPRAYGRSSIHLGKAVQLFVYITRKIFADIKA